MTSHRTIWKFCLPLQDDQVIQAPRAWIPLSVGLQGGQVFLWAVVEPGGDLVNHPIQIRGTGHPLGAVGLFVGTVLLGSFVWHVFAGPAS